MWSDDPKVELPKESTKVTVSVTVTEFSRSFKRGSAVEDSQVSKSLRGVGDTSVQMVGESEEPCTE